MQQQQPRGAALGGGQGGQSGLIVQVPGDPTPEAILRGFRAAREELHEQIEFLEDRREDITQQIQQTSSDASRRGLEQRLTEIDSRILEVERQLAVADKQVAEAAAFPGAVPPPAPRITQPPRPPSLGNPPEEYIVLGGMFMILVLFPLTIAYARRLWKRSGQVISAVPAHLMERLAQIEQTVESIAIEVERIGEGQRFMTRVFARHAAPGEALPASLTDELELPRTGPR